MRDSSFILIKIINQLSLIRSVDNTDIVRLVTVKCEMSDIFTLKFAGLCC